MGLGVQTTWLPDSRTNSWVGSRCCKLGCRKLFWPGRELYCKQVLSGSRASMLHKEPRMGHVLAFMPARSSVDRCKSRHLGLYGIGRTHTWSGPCKPKPWGVGRLGCFALLC